MTSFYLIEAVIPAGIAGTQTQGWLIRKAFASVEFQLVLEI